MTDVSVVIPAKDAAGTLADTLSSVLIAPEVGEVIVVDDGSEDGTAEVARRSGDARVRIVLGNSSGIAAALNTGFANLTRPFVARCDADDMFPPDRFTWQLAWLRENPDFIAVSGGFATLFPDGSHAADLACEGESREVTEQLRCGQAVTHLCTWLTRAEAIAQAGGARVWFDTAEDVDLQFRLAEVGRIWHVPRLAYRYRLHAASITHRTSSERVDFYHEHARQFALERRDGGKDRLQQGFPPTPPPEPNSHEQRRDPESQAIGHAVGAAWKEFNAGSRGIAWTRLRKLLLRRPFSVVLWRNVLVLILLELRRSLFSS